MAILGVTTHMKILRVPWIRCRADELSAVECELAWRGRAFVVLAACEQEAREWWRELGEAERNDLLGMGRSNASDELSLF